MKPLLKSLIKSSAADVSSHILRNRSTLVDFQAAFSQVFAAISIVPPGNIKEGLRTAGMSARSDMFPHSCSDSIAQGRPRPRHPY